MPSRTLIFLLSHSAAGGAQEIWANLAEGFAARGYRVKLMALYPNADSICPLPDGWAWDYVVRRAPRDPISAAWLLRQLARKLRREGTVTVFTALPAANVAAAIAARMAGLAGSVVISHHSPTETHNSMLDRVDARAGSLSSVKRVVSVSDAVNSSLVRKPAAYRAKRQTIHNALPPRIEQLLAGLSRNHRPRTVSTRTAIATGRLTEQKNYPLFIRAAALAPDVDFQIVGDGPDRDALVALSAELGTTERIAFLGWRPREEALASANAADVFVQVSLFEGHSLALVEAAHLGLPLIVSDVPVQIEGITAKDGTRCGIAVGVDDAEGLATAITGLLDDPVAYASWSTRSAALGAEATYDAMMNAYEALVA